MKTSVIILGLFFTTIVTSAQAEAATEKLAQETAEKCSSAIADFKGKGDMLKAVRGDYEHSKGRGNRCKYLKYQMEYLVEADRMLNMCDPLLRPEASSLVKQSHDLLQRTKDLQKKYCAQANLLEAY